MVKTMLIRLVSPPPSQKVCNDYPYDERGYLNLFIHIVGGELSINKKPQTKILRHSPTLHVHRQPFQNRHIVTRIRSTRLVFNSTVNVTVAWVQSIAYSSFPHCNFRGASDSHRSSVPSHTVFIYLFICICF